ncbi:hypothetical protein J5226_06995 [Lysobacter sp. K5869]|uniref:hypothetical protein n=1 Tax=Lysobacter sp. K5869 TaxID=2820808 RepID=UPI001C063A1E|nr:hypothetical protein [Lysobacter sp. K5869]QWP78136.1 hypothetical protein J5226_06995 [Lysobacter sp. K5869]
MTAPSSTPIDATTPEQAADEAAAAADRAAAAAASAMPPPKPAPPSSARLPMPQGPALANEELRKRVLALIGSLTTARDTESAHVAKVLGVPLGPDPEDADSRAVQGQLTGGGRYAVRVSTLYSEGPPGKHVGIYWTPAGWKGDPRQRENAPAACSLDFAPLSDDIAALGYSRGKGPSGLKERWGFRKDVPANHITFYVVVNLYRALDGSDPKGRPCVFFITIDANDDEVDYG